MKEYTVNQLAKLAGISVRTLHHYDHIGLLRPATRNHARYRFYGEKELLRLQQILFFRELDFPLSEIGRILDGPGFDPAAALGAHREELQKRAERLAAMLATIDKTIRKLKGDEVEMTDGELYGGLSKNQAEAYAEEARRKWDPKIVDETNAKVMKWSKEKWAGVNGELDEILREFASRMPAPVEGPEVQALVARHHAYLKNFFDVSPEMYRGLGKLYVEDPRFRAYFEKYRSGLADYLAKAIEHYCGPRP